MSIDFSLGLTKKQLHSPVKEFLHPVDTVFFEQMKIKEALNSLQSKKIRNMINYFYIVDEQYRLVGIVSTRDLLFSGMETDLKSVMTRQVIKVLEEIELKEAVNLLAEKRLLALPVVDKENHLKGIIEVCTKEKEEESVRSKIDQDIFQLIGFTLEQAKIDSSLAEYSYRMPWLLCNMVGGLLCAVIAGFFKETLSSVVVLALFIPLVLSLAESVSMQSMTLSLQFLHQKTIFWDKVLKRIWIEWKVGVFLGFSSAVLVSIGYIIFHQDIKPVIAIGVSIFLSMMMSAILGSIIPIGVHALRLDPKVAAGPVVLTLADMIATSIYLGLATYLLI